MRFEADIKIKGIKGLREDMDRGLIEGTNKASLTLVNHIKREHLRGGTSRTRLRVRSGRTVGLTKPIPAVRDGKFIVGGVNFGPDFGSPHIGKLGSVTVIRPKSSKYLTIPLDAALTSAGVMKYENARAYPDLEFIPRLGKDPLLAKVDENFDIEPFFVLKEKVEVPARIDPDLIDKAISPKLARDIANITVKIMKGRG